MNVETFLLVLVGYLLIVLLRTKFSDLIDKIKIKIKKNYEKIRDLTPNSIKKFFGIIAKDISVLGVLLFISLSMTIKGILYLIRNLVSIVLFLIFSFIIYVIYEIRNGEIDRCLTVKIPFKDEVILCLSDILVNLTDFIKSVL